MSNDQIKSYSLGWYTVDVDNIIIYIRKFVDETVHIEVRPEDNEVSQSSLSIHNFCIEHLAQTTIGPNAPIGS